MLRGAKNDGPIAEFTPSPAFPAVQYLESVDTKGPAYEAGLRDGDFIIEVNMELASSFFFRELIIQKRHLCVTIKVQSPNLLSLACQTHKFKYRSFDMYLQDVPIGKK